GWRGAGGISAGVAAVLARVEHAARGIRRTAGAVDCGGKRSARDLRSVSRDRRDGARARSSDPDARYVACTGPPDQRLVHSIRLLPASVAACLLIACSGRDDAAVSSAQARAPNQPVANGGVASR